MSLSQLHKKQLEEFDEQFCKSMQDSNGYMDENKVTVYLPSSRDIKIKSHLTQSTLSTLQAVWKMLEEGKREVNYQRGGDYERGESYNQALKDTQKKIEEEIIKIKEMKI